MKFVAVVVGVDETEFVAVEVASWRCLLCHPLLTNGPYQNLKVGFDRGRN